MHAARSITEARLSALALTAGERPRFRALLAAGMVFWALAWTLTMNAGVRQAADGGLGGAAARPALLQCEPGNDARGGALLRCRPAAAGTRLRQI